MMTRFGHICLLLLLSTTIESKAVSDHNSAAVCQVQKIELEQLPDLNISRAGHQVFCSNGEYVVAGGHTNGFVPTPTAEYFKDGQWHVIQMTYCHDFALSAKLKSGKILIAGGCEQPSGIGQTFNAERHTASEVSASCSVNESGHQPSNSTAAK